MGCPFQRTKYSLKIFCFSLPCSTVVSSQSRSMAAQRQIHHLWAVADSSVDLQLSSPSVKTSETRYELSNSRVRRAYILAAQLPQ